MMVLGWQPRGLETDHSIPSQVHHLHDFYLIVLYIFPRPVHTQYQQLAYILSNHWSLPPISTLTPFVPFFGKGMK